MFPHISKVSLSTLLALFLLFGIGPFTDVAYAAQPSSADCLKPAPKKPSPKPPLTRKKTPPPMCPICESCTKKEEVVEECWTSSIPIYIYGDSTTQRIWSAMSSSCSSAKISGIARSGVSSASLLASSAWAGRIGGGVVVLNVGANDAIDKSLYDPVRAARIPNWPDPITGYKSRLTTLVQREQLRGSRVVLLTAPYLPEETYGSDFAPGYTQEEYVQAVRDVGAATGVKVCDQFGMTSDAGFGAAPTGHANAELAKEVSIMVWACLREAVKEEPKKPLM